MRLGVEAVLFRLKFGYFSPPDKQKEPEQYPAPLGVGTITDSDIDNEDAIKGNLTVRVKQAKVNSTRQADRSICLFEFSVTIDHAIVTRRWNCTGDVREIS